MQHKHTIEQALTKAQTNCRNNGARLTTKRKNILYLLLDSDKPLSAYELAGRYSTQFRDPIPVMSIYRMLEFLMAENLTHKLESTNKYIACAHIACNHRHEIPQFLICEQCHTVEEIGICKEIIDALERSVTSAGFILTKSQIELHCLCKKCVEAT